MFDLGLLDVEMPPAKKFLVSNEPNIGPEMASAWRQYQTYFYSYPNATVHLPQFIKRTILLDFYFSTVMKTETALLHFMGLKKYILSSVLLCPLLLKL